MKQTAILVLLLLAVPAALEAEGSQPAAPGSGRAGPEIVPLAAADRAMALALLREAGVGFCNVDLPELPGLPPRTAFVTSETAYVRLHGRNAKKWWEHDEAWERYDYSYTTEELSEWVPRLLEMEAEAKRLYVFANNHWEGQSIATARQLVMLLEQQES